MSSKQLYLHFVNKRVNELLKEKKCKITIITLEPVLNINKMDKNLKKNRTCDFKKLVQEAISKINFCLCKQKQIQTYLWKTHEQYQVEWKTMCSTRWQQMIAI